MDITITVAIKPEGKKTPNPIIVGKRIKTSAGPAVLNARARARKDPRTEKYEKILARAIEERWPYDAPLPRTKGIGIDYLFVRPRPQKFRPKRHPGGLIWCPAKPDWDNMVKGCQDAIIRAVGRLIGDDAAVVVGRAASTYAERDGYPRITFRIHDILPDLTMPPPWLEGLINHDPLLGERWEEIPT